MVRKQRSDNKPEKTHKHNMQNVSIEKNCYPVVFLTSKDKNFPIENKHKMSSKKSSRQHRYLPNISVT